MDILDTSNKVENETKSLTKDTDSKFNENIVKKKYIIKIFCLILQQEFKGILYL